MEHIFYGFQTMGLALKPQKTLILWFSNHGFGFKTAKNHYSIVFKPWNTYSMVFKPWVWL
jgi:hypothetical protein